MEACENIIPITIRIESGDLFVHLGNEEKEVAFIRLSRTSYASIHDKMKKRQSQLKPGKYVLWLVPPRRGLPSLIPFLHHLPEDNEYSIHLTDGNIEDLKHYSTLERYFRNNVYFSLNHDFIKKMRFIPSKDFKGTVFYNNKPLDEVKFCDRK